MDKLTQLKLLLAVGKRVTLAACNVINHNMLGKSLLVTQHTESGVQFGNAPFGTYVPWPDADDAEYAIEFRGDDSVTINLHGVSMLFEVQG